MLLKMVNFMCIMQQLKTKRSQGPVRQILDLFLRQKAAEEGDMCIWPFLFIYLSHLVIKNFATCVQLRMLSLNLCLVLGSFLRQPRTFLHPVSSLGKPVLALNVF